MFLAISLFAASSGLAGGSRNPGLLITSFKIQGLGTGGFYILSDIVICNRVPPRHRGPYLSTVLSPAAIGTTIGPIIGALPLKYHGDGFSGSIYRYQASDFPPFCIFSMSSTSAVRHGDTP
jgi:MFS family permease